MFNRIFATIVKILTHVCMLLVSKNVSQNFVTTQF
jgi:hypothetical protein